MLIDRSRIREGMAVFSSDGEKLGKVLSCDATTFTIEKGFFFPKDYIARYDEIADVVGDDVRLAMTKDSFVNLREAGGDTAYESTSDSMAARTRKDSVSMPIHEEEVEIRKRPVVKEEVRLRKDRVTEQRAAEADVGRQRGDVEGAEGARRIEDATTNPTRRDLADPYTGTSPMREDDDLD